MFIKQLDISLLNSSASLGCQEYFIITTVLISVITLGALELSSADTCVWDLLDSQKKVIL